MDQTVKISAKLLQDVVNYLGTCPFQEVANFIISIQGEVSKSQQPQEPQGEPAQES